MTEEWRKSARLIREEKKEPGPSAPELAVPLVLGKGGEVRSVTHITRGASGPSLFIVGSPKRPQLVTGDWDDVRDHMAARGLEAPDAPPAPTAASEGSRG